MESSNFNENNSVTCLDDFSISTEKATIITKGIPSLNDFCKIRVDTLLQDNLERQEPVGRVLLHPKYRRVYVDPKRAKCSSDSPPQPLQRNLN